jgi:HAMP domain-containing protein
MAAKDCRLLRIWNPIQGDLGMFLASISRWLTRTTSQLLARRKEVQLEEVQFRMLADTPDSRLSPEEVAQLKEGEAKVRAWEVELGLLERTVWEMRREGATSRAIGLFLGRDHKTVCAILVRLQQGLRRILEGREP